MCYGKGGTEPTISDANLVLGRINPKFFLGGGSNSTWNGPGRRFRNGAPLPWAWMLTGADEPVLDALVGEIGTRHPEVEIEIHAGGQPHYPLLLSAE